MAAGQYYAHPRNLFWDLVGAAIGRSDLPALPYAQRTETLLSAGIGLWDVFASARRDGSLDSAIRDPERAALDNLIGSLPRLEAIAFNGAAAARTGRQLVGASPAALVDLPSSSPAYAAMPRAAKLERWRALAAYLG